MSMQALLHGKYYCVAIKQVVIASKHYCMYSNACEKISKYERLIYLSPLPVSVVDTRRRAIDSHWCRQVGRVLVGSVPGMRRNDDCLV